MEGERVSQKYSKEKQFQMLEFMEYKGLWAVYVFSGNNVFN